MTLSHSSCGCLLSDPYSMLIVDDIDGLQKTIKIMLNLIVYWTV
jgi:hypothetical protein